MLITVYLFVYGVIKVIKKSAPLFLGYVYLCFEEFFLNLLTVVSMAQVVLNVPTQIHTF